jgi:hypothetical protein
VTSTVVRWTHIADLEDYSGEFIPNLLRLQDFSKDALVRLVEAASKDDIGLEGIWLSTIRRRYGDEVAFSSSKEVWQTTYLPEVQHSTSAMNISGDNIAALFKYLQIDTAFGAMFTVKCELIRPNLGIATVTM